ncbi:hypothetical protein FHT21_005154 [Pedobacter sp. SG908]|nr:hypothetical protein [Pedobacter sp. SG908]
MGVGTEPILHWRSRTDSRTGPKLKATATALQKLLLFLPLRDEEKSEGLVPACNTDLRRTLIHLPFTLPP